MTQRRHRLGNQHGIALLETIPLLVIFVMLVSFGIGFFGVVHTAILHSIAARTFAFETFRNRTNLTYFRENFSGLDRPVSYQKKGFRYHAVQNAGESRNRFVGTPRQLALGRGAAAADASESVHNSRIYDLKARNEDVEVSPAWIMVGYGMCLNAGCGN